jgi:hypothetical protein
MTSHLTQIKQAYEVNKMTPEEIALDLHQDLVAIKAALMNCSTLYRRDCGAESDDESGLNFSKDEQRTIKKAMYELALTAESETVKADLMKYIRDDSKGRKDIKNALNGQPINFLQFNTMIQEARAKRRDNQLVEV